MCPYAIVNTLSLFSVMHKGSILLNTIIRIKRKNDARPLLLVALVWAVGSVTGSWIAYNMPLSAVMQAREVAMFSGQWAVFAVKSTCPILIAFFVARFLRRKLLFLLLFLKSTMVGFSVCLFKSAFGSAGWLVVLLLFSCEFVCCWLLVCYVSCLLCYKDKLQKKMFTLCLFLMQAVVSFECFILSPFTASLFTNY